MTFIRHVTRLNGKINVNIVLRLNIHIHCCCVIDVMVEKVSLWNWVTNGPFIHSLG